MAFVIGENHLPATLTTGPMSDEAFAELVAEHPDLRFEMTAQGELLIMPPPYNITGIRETEISRQLSNWAKTDNRGVTGGPTTGFVLPNGARYAPDASWTLNSRLQQLSPEMMERYWHICPDFVIELRSHTSVTNATQKDAGVDRESRATWLVD